jgi:hypothetical protein
MMKVLMSKGMFKLKLYEQIVKNIAIGIGLELLLSILGKLAGIGRVHGNTYIMG